MRKLITILLILLCSCKTADYICNVDGYGQDEYLFYETCYKLDAKIKRNRLERLSNHSVKIYYNDEYYYVNFNCELINQKSRIGLPIFTARDTADIIRDSETMEIYKFELLSYD